MRRCYSESNAAGIDDSYSQMFGQLLKHRRQIISLLRLLIDKTKSERGYSATGRLLSRVLHTLAGIYPINSRFVNTDEWENPGKSRLRNMFISLLRPSCRI
jgi:hypothetical protein